MRSLQTALTTAIIALAATPLLAEESIGISKTKPSEGRSVEIDGAYMVSYTMKIPGTDAEVTMIPIPGGEFLLGSPGSDSDKQKDEQPQVRVGVEPFWMARTEVSWAEYLPFMNLYAHFKEFEHRKIRLVDKDNPVDAITAPTELYDPSYTFEYGEDPQQPAVTMTQYAAKQYTKWVSGVTGHKCRLPSEAEWEYACRAGTTTVYHFGNDPKQLDEYAWHILNTPDEPQKVGSKKPNPWGLHDMHGSVWEWVLDGYDETNYQRLLVKSKGKTLPSNDAVSWPTKAYPRVVRGGSWEDDPDRCRAAAKLGSDDPEWKLEDPNLPLSPWWFTSDPSRGVGFRMVRPLHAPTKKEMAKYWDADHDDIKFDVDGRLSEGRGAIGLVDPDLPAAIKALDD
ncbi:MAG: formylglycine-generating enzyme family protein [Pirellulaceae bacterium]|jgi:formylglycine-generating enzyme required for sulfatase activity|nr:formylglycine-generating enzyme family protein [Pirellulaceae bacterium]HJN07611.1 formylglycine-generating enzyme family protein [Pirellulaceae bacterium]